MQEQQRRREQCWARWDVSGVSSQLQNTHFCFNLRLGKNLVCCSVEESVLHGTACEKLLCCCYLSYRARLAAPCHPALLCASPGQELGTL